MTFELVYARQAQRRLEKLNPQTALRIVGGCERLKRNPFPDGNRLQVGIFAWCFNGLEVAST